MKTPRFLFIWSFFSTQSHSKQGTLLNKKMRQLDPKNTIPSVIVEEATRLDKIISDFLNYARPKKPHRLPCKIDDIVEKNLVYLDPQITAGNYQIKKDYAETIPELQADANLLYQAFLNLLINAMQAMPEGGLIQIGLKANADSIRAQFTNDGAPIAHEDLEKIWEPFFTTKDMGTGLGLSIVKNIVEAHNGTTTIENVGTERIRVTITLPVA